MLRVTSRPLAAAAGLLFASTFATAGCLEQDDDTGGDQIEIVGGADTDISAVPWQVSLQTGGGSHFCGGSIVAPTWIVTAAHCVDGGAPARILAGATRRSQPGTGQVVSVLRAISIPGYVDASAGKDIAMLELATPLTLNGTTVKAIAPVLPADAQAGIESPGVTATVSGWGTLQSGAQGLPDTLQSVQVPIVSLTDARADYGFNISPDQIAAGVRGVGGRDSCQGDSGGPLVVTSATGEPKLAGVVSWGNGCADPNFPGMYARVSSFSAFLDEYIGGPPTAVAGDDQQVDQGGSVTLDATASTDVGAGTIASYAWVQTVGTPVALTADGAKATFVAPDAAGDLEFELTVTDDRGNTATDTLVVTVLDEDTPPGGDDIPPGGDDTPPGQNPPSGQRPADLVGGCAAGGGSGHTGLALLLSALGLVAWRRRRS